MAISPATYLTIYNDPNKKKVKQKRTLGCPIVDRRYGGVVGDDVDISRGGQNDGVRGFRRETQKLVGPDQHVGGVASDDFFPALRLLLLRFISRLGKFQLTDFVSSVCLGRLFPPLSILERRWIVDSG